MTPPTLLSAALLLLLLPPTLSYNRFPIDVVVQNSVSPAPPKIYRTHVEGREILLRVLTRLQDSSENFTFTYGEHPDYCPFLQSVNGLAGNYRHRTYWKLQVKSATGKVRAPHVGIGCYLPEEKEQIILNFSKY